MSATADQLPGVSHWRLSRDTQVLVLVCIAYYLGAEAAFLVGTLSDRIFAPFWPPNLVLLCALVFTPPRHWWRFIVAVLPAHVAAEWSIGMNTQGIAITFVSNCLVAVLNAFALQRWCKPHDWLGSLKSTAIYVFATVMVCPALAAFIGAFVPIATGGALDNYGRFWAQWYASNALGAATLGPFALLLLGEGTSLLRSVSPTRRIEAVVVIVALLATSSFAFRSSATLLYAGYVPALLYLPLPLILWAAVRFGVLGASGSTLLVGAVLLARSLNSGPMFGLGDAESNVFAIQIFLIGLSVPVLLLGSAINDTRRAERATREREERMAFAAASADVGLWVYRFADGGFWTTDHALKMLRLPHNADLTLPTLLSAVHPRDAGTVSAAMKAAISRRQPIDFEFRLREQNGETRWLSMRARSHGDGDPSVAEMSGTFADVTARKIAEREAAEQRKEIAHLMRVSMLGELSGGLAHELTQPLTAILSNAEAGRMLLAEPEPDLEELSGILADIITADSRAGEVIHRLRSLLKKGDVRYETVDLNSLIESTLRLLHNEVINRKVKLQCDLSSNLGVARGDPIQMQQVLLNLLLNAMDAMEELSPSQRILTIATRMVGSDIEVRVSDCGSGLPAAQADIVKPFFTTKRRGLGLGLSICTSIAKSHGGTLSLTNNLNEGATATFRLPSCQM
jgi:signal transduction histidine kinase